MLFRSADAVTPANQQKSSRDRSTGFVFENASSEAMLGGIADALAVYKDAPRWLRMQVRAMRRDSSWTRAARQYASLYQKLAVKRLLAGASVAALPKGQSASRTGRRTRPAHASNDVVTRPQGRTPQMPLTALRHDRARRVT